MFLKSFDDPLVHCSRQRKPALSAVPLTITVILSFVCILQALRLKPDYPNVLLRKARLHRRLGQWDLAIEVRTIREYR